MTCRDCLYYQADPKNLGRGTCNEKPPVTATAFTQNGPLTATVRPNVMGDDRACASGKSELAAAEWEKTVNTLCGPGRAGK